MIVEAAWLVLGLALLLGGGDLLVRGASGLAREFGISPLTIGLTVVAFGTSAPELSTTLTAAWHGSGELSFGNIMGSNLANIGLILAAAALIRPFEVDRLIVTREIPMMLLATAAAAALAFDRPRAALHSALGAEQDAYGRIDGLILLLLFAVFVGYTWRDIRRQRALESESAAPDGSGIATASLLKIAVGLGGLVVGAQLTVTASVSIAGAMGVPEAVIGLTLVAVGTSLPELATSIVAVARRQAEVAIGNVVGSNIMNLLLVGGLTATAYPIPIPEGGFLDLLAVGVLSLLMLAMSQGRTRSIVRAEAGVLLALYLAYLSLRTFYL